jgi:hypothetical protein
VSGYEGKHRRHADPDELGEVSSGLRGLANWIEILDDDE